MLQLLAQKKRMAFLFSAERETKITPRMCLCRCKRFRGGGQDLRHNVGSVSDRQVKAVCVCVCVHTVLSICSSNQFPPQAEGGFQSPELLADREAVQPTGEPPSRVCKT